MIIRIIIIIIIIIIIMVNPCSRLLLEELDRQSRNSPHLKRPKPICVFTRTQIMISAIKIMLKRNSLESEVTDCAVGDRASFPCGAWIGLSVMSIMFKVSN
jgi:hypothetical protein